jgi:hypothetical protein
VRYHLDEDPKCLHTFPCGLPPMGKTPPHYDRIAVAPGAAILAAAAGSTLHWVDLKTGAVLEKAENAHEGEADTGSELQAATSVVLPCSRMAGGGAADAPTF